MKCPTCGYIGFETSDRCRNCGYDFTLASPAVAEAPELARAAEQTEGALREIDMRPAPAPAPVRKVSRESVAERQPDLDKVLQNLDRVLGGEPAAGGPSHVEGPDLPLFDEDPQASADLPPMVDPAAAPRRPLSVRRTTPDPGRLKSRPARHQPEAERSQLPLPAVDDPAPVIVRHERVRRAAEEPAAASPARRVMAAVLDLTILGAIDAVVVYFTLRLCGLSTADVLILPPVPLAAFFTLVNGGYLAAFTAAGGQTIGKMALGIKVVGHADLPVTGGLAIVRAIGCLASVASLGLGFLPALIGGGGRAIEDRLADTRVVRVTA
jgi:uncharacterized RDD family membrane protein YckC